MVKRWIEFARWVPTGGNAQPWLVTFETKGGYIAIRLAIDPQYRFHPELMKEVSDILSNRRNLVVR